MSVDPVKKKRGRRRIDEAIAPALSYLQIDSIPEEEIQIKINKAFDILFSEILKEKINKPN